MNSPVFYLVFVSAATDLCTDAELLSLLETCRNNNAKRGITGLLLYYEGSFIEIIEGPQGTIEWLFKEKVSHDKRHHCITKLITGTEDHRSFPDWSMGFKRITKAMVQKQIPQFNTILESHSKPETIYSEIYTPLLVFLRSFYRSSGYSARD